MELSLSDFYKKLQQEEPPQIPTVKKKFLTDSQIYGFVKEHFFTTEVQTLLNRLNYNIKTNHYKSTRKDEQYHHVVEWVLSDTMDENETYNISISFEQPWEEKFVNMMTVSLYLRREDYFELYNKDYIYDKEQIIYTLLHLLTTLRNKFLKNFSNLKENIGDSSGIKEFANIFNQIPNCNIKETEIFTDGIAMLVEFSPEKTIQVIETVTKIYEVIIVADDSIGKDIQIDNFKYLTNIPLSKTLVTHVTELFRSLMGTRGVEMLNLWSMAQGAIGLYKYNNSIYQVLIRPGKFVGYDYPIGQFKGLFGYYTQKEIDDTDISGFF